MACFRSWLLTAGVNVSPQRFSLRSGSMGPPFVCLRDRFQNLTTGDCYQRSGEFVGSSHCAQECLVILNSPQPTNTVCRYITNPSPDRRRFVAVTVCHFDPHFPLAFAPHAN